MGTRSASVSSLLGAALVACALLAPSCGDDIDTNPFPNLAGPRDQSATVDGALPLPDGGTTDLSTSRDDSGTSSDGAAADASSPDAAPADAVSPDAPPADAAAADAAPTPDAALLDGPPPDAPPRDALPADGLVPRDGTPGDQSSATRGRALHRRGWTRPSSDAARRWRRRACR